MDGGLFDFWLQPSPRLRRTGRFGSVTGFFKPAPSPKPRQKSKILAAHRYVIFVNALKFVSFEFPVLSRKGALIVRVLFFFGPNLLHARLPEVLGSERTPQ
jgi:hypothetical protein